MDEQSRSSPRMVNQIQFEFYRKPSAPQNVIHAESAHPWEQKRTAMTQEVVRILLNCRRELNCTIKQQHLSNLIQRMKNSGQNEIFWSEVLKAGLQGYNKILEADNIGSKPIYRSKEWKCAAIGLEKRKKKTNWLGPFYKSCIFVPPTPGGELKKRMQAKEKELRTGGREDYPIKIIETAGRPLERALVKSDPFNGNQCHDKKCFVQVNTNNKTQLSIKACPNT